MELLPAGSLKIPTEFDKQLSNEYGRFYNDPLGFVQFNFHWGQGDLEKETGPDIWQKEYLVSLGNEITKRQTGELGTAIRMATASGHGIGKSAVVAWIIIWFMCTRPNPAIVVTANTQSQLSSKTWRELAKWHRRALNRHWFQWTATKFYHVLFQETWYASAIPWSESNPDAFAGTHETEVLMLFDEASSIADQIWETVTGAMTTPGACWLVFGNPTRTEGRFYQCFQPESRWVKFKVDSRTAKVANIHEINEWIKEYGEDSDFVRVRILGEFPRMSATQFIPTDVVHEATKRRVDSTQYNSQRPIIGVDVAGYGGDQSVIVVRQGSYVHPAMKWREIDTMELSSHVVDACRKFGQQSVACVDGIGMGAGVVDRLNHMGINVIDVQSSARPIDPRTYVNKRAELWGKLKDSLITSLCIPDDKELKEQLCTLQYALNKKLQIQLQSKTEIRSSKGSPDVADALAYTFAYEEAAIFARASRARRVIHTGKWT